MIILLPRVSNFTLIPLNPSVIWGPAQDQSFWWLKSWVKADPLWWGLIFSTCLSCCCSLGTDVASLILLILMASTAIAGGGEDNRPFPFLYQQIPLPPPITCQTPPPPPPLPPTPFALSLSTSLSCTFSFDLTSPRSRSPSHLTSICLEEAGSRKI